MIHRSMRFQLDAKQFVHQLHVIVGQSNALFSMMREIFETPRSCHYFNGCETLARKDWFRINGRLDGKWSVVGRRWERTFNSSDISSAFYDGIQLPIYFWGHYRIKKGRDCARAYPFGRTRCYKICCRIFCRDPDS